MGESLATCPADPAACPNATDKAFLPGHGTSSSNVLRAGVCLTSADLI